MIINKAIKLTDCELIAGKDKTSGSIKFKNGPPASFCRFSFHYMNTTNAVFIGFTDEKGFFNINNIDLKKGPFFVVSHDPTGEHNGVIADNIGGPNYVDD